jgi:hypothetical protein
MGCARAGVVAQATRVSEGLETDGYRCADGHTFLVDWSAGAPTAPTWPPSPEDLEVVAWLARRR